jgi:hypothetical protein
LIITLAVSNIYLPSMFRKWHIFTTFAGVARQHNCPRWIRRHLGWQMTSHAHGLLLPSLTSHRKYPPPPAPWHRRDPGGRWARRCECCPLEGGGGGGGEWIVMARGWCRQSGCRGGRDRRRERVAPTMVDEVELHREPWPTSPSPATAGCGSTTGGSSARLPYLLPGAAPMPALGSLALGSSEPQHAHALPPFLRCTDQKHMKPRISKITTPIQMPITIHSLRVERRQPRR